MPAVSAKQMIQNILNAIYQSGGSAAYTSNNTPVHPRKFVINKNGHTFSVWVYIWTLTHGGRASLPDEYRIQMTSVASPLEKNPSGLTVLMGYYPSLDMFAGFDLRKHSIFTTGSPSVQIDISAIHDALQNGLSFITKDNDEIAVGVRPDQFLFYCANALILHAEGSDTAFNTLLSKVVDELTVTPEDFETLPLERKKIISEVVRYSRASNFRKLVLNAYDNRCAILRTQLRLVDAAHIVPVASAGSHDSINNGIALSPTLHRAYDNCLIYLDEDCKMQLNEQKFEELTNAGLGSGVDNLTPFLDKKIHLPTDITQRPKPEFISEANKYRQIPGY
jgi:putative restriction endonuclease